MKNLFTFLGFLTYTFFIAQNFGIEDIAKMEQRTFASQQEILRTSMPDNSGYDVLKYTLDITANPSVSNFSGNTEIKFKAKTTISQMVVNAKSTLTISAVQYQGNPITTYSRSGNNLTITFPSSLATNNIATVKVFYTGSANTSSGLSIDFHSSTPILSTLSESFHASSWFICKDNLLDKADEGVEVYITHPSNTKAGSNGTLQSVTNLGNGNYKTYWKSTYPIVPYLIAIAVTNYVEYNTNVTINGTNVPIINYVYPEDLSSVQADLDNVGNYVSFFSQKFGDYPFKNEKYGHCQWEWGGGMEHQTMSFMVAFDRGLVAHELAHQWFGDKVTCGTWKDIWLNEGFATYLAALVIENEDGSDAFKSWKQSSTNYITSSTSGSVYINNDADALNENRIFDSRLSYQKGAMVLNMLRYKMGDTAFYQAINNYLNNATLAYNFALTTDLQSQLEAVYGQSLTEFFADWVFGEGYPIFNVAVSNNVGSKSVTVNQTQSHTSVSFFETPIDITFNGSGGQTITKRLEITQNNQTFTFTDIPFTITSYEFNSSADIICKINSATLAVDDIATNNIQFTMYPNPVKNVATISGNDLIESISIFSADGLLVKSIEGNRQNSQQITLADLPNGSYILSISHNQMQENLKFIMKK